MNVRSFSERWRNQSVPTVLTAESLVCITSFTSAVRHYILVESNLRRNTVPQVGIYGFRECIRVRCFVPTAQKNKSFYSSSTDILPRRGGQLVLDVVYINLKQAYGYIIAESRLTNSRFVIYIKPAITGYWN